MDFSLLVKRTFTLLEDVDDGEQDVSAFWRPLSEIGVLHLAEGEAVDVEVLEVDFGELESVHDAHDPLLNVGWRPHVDV